MRDEAWLSSSNPMQIRCPHCGVWRPIAILSQDTRLCTCGFHSKVVEPTIPETLSAYAMVASVLAGPNDALTVRPNAALSAVCEVHNAPPTKAVVALVAPLPSLLEPERDLPKPLPRVGWCRHLTLAVSLDGREFVCLTYACGARFVPGGFDKGLTAREVFERTWIGCSGWRELKGRRIIRGPDNIQAACDWRPTTTARYAPLVDDMRADPTLFLIAICGEGGALVALRLVSPVNDEARPPEGGWGWNKPAPIGTVKRALLPATWTDNTDRYQVIDPDAPTLHTTFETLACSIAKTYSAPTARRRRPLVLLAIAAVEGNRIDLPRDVFELAYVKSETEAVAEMRCTERGHIADLVTRARTVINEYKAAASDLSATTLPAKETEPYRFKCWVEALTERCRQRRLPMPTGEEKAEYNVTLARFILSAIGWRAVSVAVGPESGIRPTNGNRISTGVWRAIWQTNPPTRTPEAAWLLRGIGLHSEADLILAVEAALNKRGGS